MKWLIISDTHLHKFDKDKEDYLYALFSKYDNIIVNGDFWDKWYITYSDFEREYSRILNLLSTKNCIYILGNHDDIDISPVAKIHWYKSINVDTHSLEINSDKNERTRIHIEHGHRLGVNPYPRVVMNIYNWIINRGGKFIFQLLLLLEKLAYMYIPQFIHNSKLGLKRNIMIIEKIRTKYNISDYDVFVTSDTHTAHIDMSNKYINTGSNVGGYFSYLVVDSTKLGFSKYNLYSGKYVKE